MKKQQKIKSLLKASIISVVLVITAFTNLTLALPSISNCEEAANYIIEQLSIDKDEVFIHVWGPLNKGVEVFSTKSHIIDVPENGYITYIDLYPRANLFHPVKYIFLSEDTEEFIIKDDNYPPVNFGDYQMIDTKIGEVFKSAYNRRAPINFDKPKNPVKEKSDSRYAVLMNGGYNSGNNHVRYWNDLSNIYITLVEAYDFPDENIIVLCSDGLDPAADQSNGENSDPDLDGDGDEDIMYSCTLSDVDMVFEELAETMSGGGELFVFTTDHGDTNGGYDTFFCLWNMEELTDAHFADLLADIPASEIICTFEPCFSGGFIDNVVVPPGPVAASSACRHDEYSWAMGNLLYDEYAFYWTAAVKGEDAFGEPVDADYNEDGKISMDEAFIFAEAHDEQSEEPQYGDYPEGIGELITLWPGSQAPDIPTKPDGPDQCTEYEPVIFSTSATEPDGEEVFYRFDWGDGTLSDWIGPYTSGQTGEATYNWTVIGEYEVKSIAKDINGVQSEWSEPATIAIVDNQIPNQPIMEGPKFGTTGKDLEFKVTTVDPDNHDLFYFIKWDDGTMVDWEGPYQSGEEVTFTHKYTEGGSLTIITIAKDIISEKSQQCSHKINIIKNRAFTRQVNLRLLDFFMESFSNLIVRLGAIK
ncbi:hypothetical protein AYK21_03815 [Thermoplasmatales archaeon SG8-52-2]|nr:MAG: hypothetical protein AYK21_03815 [Thermoplasmatales archaeon SG8-52-2]